MGNDYCKLDMRYRPLWSMKIGLGCVDYLEEGEGVFGGGV